MSCYQMRFAGGDSVAAVSDLGLTSSSRSPHACTEHDQSSSPQVVSTQDRRLVTEQDSFPNHDYRYLLYILLINLCIDLQYKAV